MKLTERFYDVKKKLGKEKKLFPDVAWQEIDDGMTEEVVVGQDYLEDNTDDSAYEKGEPIPEPESPNDLDADRDVSIEEHKEVNENAVKDFFKKYSKGDAIMQVLCKDLAAIASDIEWIVETGKTNEQFSLDFADAVNSLSVKY
jgi:hypothetical protein